MPNYNKANDLIKYGEKRMNISERQFQLGVKRTEQALFEEIRKILNVVDVSGGKLKSNAKTAEFLGSLEDRIYTALNKSGYNTSVAGFLRNFDDIKENNIKIQSVLNNENIAGAALNDITRLEVQNAIDKLTRSGISKDFIQPIKQSLYRNITLGADIIEAEKTIRDFVVSNAGADSKLLRYTKQVARDSISQYDGAIQKAIGVELELNDYLFAGSLIEDSRAQCRYWVDKQKLKGEELKAEIQTALNNGYLGGMRCSGMIPDTTVDTFSIYRGGYNCRHRAIVTKL